MEAEATKDSKPAAPVVPEAPKLGWWARRQRARWQRRFELDFRNERGWARQMVQAKAHTMAQGMVMRWMDDRRILRCCQCLTTGGLRKLGNSYFCPPHHDTVMKNRR